MDQNYLISLLQDIVTNNAMEERCPEGMYWCDTDEICKPDSQEMSKLPTTDEEIPLEMGEQDDGGEAGTSSAGEGAGTASMGKWESGLSRGAANQLGVTKWEDSYGLTRGKANPLV